MKKHTILIVDDDKEFRQTVIGFLNDRFLLIECSNGREGLEEAKTNKDIALIISDQNMPFLDGLSMIEELRKDDISTPVILVTSESGESTRNKVKQLGRIIWAVKPLIEETFNDTVDFCLDHVD